MRTDRITISGATGSPAYAIISGNSSRTYIRLENIGSNAVFLGPTSTTTSGTGLPLFAGDALEDSIYLGSYFAYGYPGSNTTINFIEEA